MHWPKTTEFWLWTAAGLQCAAMVSAVLMSREVRDRRPWLVMFGALLVMFAQRIMAVTLPVEVRITAASYFAPLVSLLLFYALFTIRRVARAERDSDLRYRSLVETSPDPTVVTTDGRIVYANPAAAVFFDSAAAADLTGTEITALGGPKPADHRPVALLDYRRLIEPGQHENHAAEPWVKPDGTEVAVEWSVSVVTWEGRPGLQWVFCDVTERFNDEREKARLLASERAARSTAEHASRMKDEFLATLSHELRTPLNAILGWAHLLKAADPTADELHQGIDTIERNAKVQTQLIEDLLDMSRIVSGKLRLSTQPTRLDKVLAAAIETVLPMAAGKSIRLLTDVDPSVGPINGDPARLQQVAWNLLTNAIKFTPAGGTVRAAVRRVGSDVELAIVDDGQGIDAEFLPYVFERFRQADSSTTRRHGGLGLGLAIVKQLVDLHGGAISASSDGPGKGSRFTVRLPATTAPALAKPDQTSTPQAGRRLAGVRALVVDDEPDSRLLVRRMLALAGAQVTTAASAAEALPSVGSVDVVVSDIGMPDVDGYEFLRLVRQKPPAAGGRVPAVALTAFARGEDRTRALVAGFRLHLSKPVSADELVAAVAAVLDRADAGPGYEI